MKVKLDIKYIAVFAVCTCIFQLTTVVLFAADEKVELQDVYIKPGDTLHAISNYYLKDPARWPEIYKYNSEQIKNPNLILPRMKIKVPVTMIKEHLRAAYMINIINNVRVREPGSAQWGKAQQNMKLFNEYTVRTLSKSVAQIKFYSKEIMKLGENSLVVLRPEEKREEAILKEGELRASRARVLTSSAIIEPTITSVSKMPEFKAEITENKTTKLSVYKGKVNLTSAGKTVTVDEGFMSQAKMGEMPVIPMKLPPMPDLKMPTNLRIGAETKLEFRSDEEDFFSGSSESVEEESDDFFGGSEYKSSEEEEPESAEVYEDENDMEDALGDAMDSVDGNEVRYTHLQVATDISFEDVVVDKKLASINDFDKNTLPDGEYYWRISYINNAGVEGAYSAIPRSFTIDRESAELKILYPPEDEVVDKEFLKIRGKTRRNSTVEINGEMAFVDEKGMFKKIIYLDPGRNIIIIEAVNSAGKRTREMLSVTREIDENLGGSSSMNPIMPIIMGVVSIGMILVVILFMPK